MRFSSGMLHYIPVCAIESTPIPHDHNTLKVHGAFQHSFKKVRPMKKTRSKKCAALLLSRLEKCDIPGRVRIENK